MMDDDTKHDTEQETPCPCGYGQSYRDCCEPLHFGMQYAQTAEQLMRSRYTAFYYGKNDPVTMIDYLLATHHQSKHQPRERESIAETMRQQRWLGLKILHTEKGQTNDKEGIVQFVASYCGPSGVAKQHYERSKFIKQDGRWFYLEGEIAPHAQLN
jgi:SEC-C motif-containing protein